MRSCPTLVLAAALATGAAAAATPPPDLNYQGVLRNASNVPLDGTYDMTFSFYNNVTGGDQILVDQHASATANAVTVSNGLFDVNLGGGTVSDGTGPGTYTTLDQVFRDYGAVWLEIQVGGETLNPRVRVMSSGYSLNAANLGGKAPNSYLDTSAVSQSKSGSLSAVTTAAASTGVTGGGTGAGGHFFDTDNSGYALVGDGDYGILAYGNVAGGFVADLDSSGQAYLGYGDYGVWALGNSAGGYFKDSNNSGYAYVGYGDDGISAFGNSAGGYFQRIGSATYTYIADASDGIDAYGTNTGGYFRDNDNSGYAYVGNGDQGIRAFGNGAGGYFDDSDGTGYAYVGSSNEGIQAYGSAAGGEFHSAGYSGYTLVASGDAGLYAYGNNWGGYFADSNSSGLAYVGIGDDGVEGEGNEAGAFFADSDSSGVAWVGYGDRGIWGKGNFAGGTFSYPDNVTFWADVSTSMYKIRGTGTNAFVQNDPYDKNKVIVYASPEGDEAAVYTRGSAKLVNGEAHVTLGDTFRLVANPDIGLTAHLTPRGDPIPLAVASVTPSELVVRGPAGSNAAFDYIVYGLRIGFEELAIVQPKDRDAFLPGAAAVDAQYAGHPELRASDPLERFTAMRSSMGIAGEPDLTRAQALEAAIDANRTEIVAAAAAAAEKERPASRRATAPALPTAGTPSPAAVAPRPTSTAPASAAPGAVTAPPLTILPASAPADSGTVLSLDPSVPGSVRPASTAFDRGVAGCAVAPPEGTTVPAGSVAAGISGVVLCNVDASFGPVAVGDLLTTSVNPGFAMRTGEEGHGAILGKAMEPLTSGTGTIHVLVSLH